MRYPEESTIFWTFNTENFRVVFSAEPCVDDPRDQFDAENVAAIERGEIEYFDAFVSVWYGQDGTSPLLYLAHDHLGGCAYKTFREFYTAHRDADPENRNTLAMKARNRAICHYFPDMVSIACTAAREEMRKLQAVKVRAA